jgi:nucleotide-binding universal stress UspA family protein
MSDSVLVPMDNSPPSKAALEYALSSHSNAEITVLYVVDTVSAAGYADLFTLAVQHEYVEERSEKLFEEAERLADDYGTALTTVTEKGTPDRTINAYIDENAIDHVVMGSHCRTGVNRLFLGSVAERVVRRAPVPVTVVPSRATTDAVGSA